eukprot:GHVU01196261.1.p1 GENE.GHVU01196261.1~~GHVU01196261.1.p1  ORF type:complete len:400 (+),score=51.28 GHVU01196261.1:319-1518(+)
MKLAIVAAVLARLRNSKRKKKMLLALPKRRGAVLHRVPPIPFDLRVQNMIYYGEFANRHRMDSYSFELLLCRIGDQLLVDERQSAARRGTPPMEAAAKLQVTIFWLAGSRASDLWEMAGCSKSHFYQEVHTVMNAICKDPAMELKFPRSLRETQAAATEFSTMSFGRVFGTCVAATDGWLLKTDAQPATRVGNPAAYYSGRYKCSGINVQFSCNAYSQFTGVSLSSPGGTNDALAYQRWGLKELVAALPPGYYIAGDAAYPLGPHLMVPFNLQDLTVARRNYNWCLSQLRIRAEMALGLFVNKWRMFEHHSHLHIDNLKKVVHTGMRLHNYVIDRRLTVEGAVRTRAWIDDGARGASTLIKPPSDCVEACEFLSDRDAGVNFREQLVQLVAAHGIVAPA